MKNEIVKQIINQIKKYDLTDSFKDKEEFEEWISKLNNHQVRNFLGLELEETKFFKHFLINNDLLKCKDYQKKIFAISTLKNSYFLYNNICNSNFLKSKNFYKDIEMLSKVDNTCSLWLLGQNAFIKSPYHQEDLKLLIETNNANKENFLDYEVSDALNEVASNINSIKSPYHQADMKLIAKVGVNFSNSSYWDIENLANLAINEVSLSDKYHLENMQILAKNPIASNFLYKIMTDPVSIKGKNYRKEVEALINAKSKITAQVLYYYIVNPDRKFMYDTYYFNTFEYDMNDIDNMVSGRCDKDYLNNLIRINKTDDKFIAYFVYLLMNPKFINSPYKKFDLELLENVSDKAIFMDLYKLVINDASLNSNHHKKDIAIISKTEITNIRKLLLKKATNKHSLNSANHNYDMNYITKLNLDEIDDKIYNEINYYLFNNEGIDDSNHKEKLENLLKGILVKRNDNISSYFDSLLTQITNNELNSKEFIKTKPTVKPKTKSKILSWLKKH